MDAISPCLIRTGCYHATATRATHNNRLADQFRVSQPFHRHKEGVEVYMDDIGFGGQLMLRKLKVEGLKVKSYVLINISALVIVFSV